MNSCINCGGAILEQGKVYGYAGPICYCAEPKPRSPYYVTLGGVSPASGGCGGHMSTDTAMILKEIAVLKEEIKCEEKRFSDLWNQFAALAKAKQELVEALEKLARLGNGDEYGNSEGNMIARAAIAKATGEQE